MGLIWLGTNTCDGHIISNMNSLHPTFRKLIENEFTMLYESFVMAAEGERASALWYLPEINQGKFGLVVEGTVPTAYGGRTSLLGKVKEKDITTMQAVKRLGSLARWVVAAGSCASFGGPFAAWPNPSGSLPVYRVLNRPVINVPGCPTNPRWLISTLLQLKAKGSVKVDGLSRPLFLYDRTVHSLCERLPLYNKGRFAREPGDDEGCMYLQGCKGPVTRADCPEKRWIEEGSSWPVGANTPCIGCTTPEFPDGVSPFFKHKQDLYSSAARVNLESVGTAAGVFTVAGITAHLVGQFITGRKKLPSGTKTLTRLLKLKRIKRN